MPLLHLKQAVPTTQKCFEHSCFEREILPKGLEFKTFHKPLICILSYQIKHIKEKGMTSWRT